MFSIFCLWRHKVVTVKGLGLLLLTYLSKREGRVSGRHNMVNVHERNQIKYGLVSRKQGEMKGADK